MNRMKSDTTEPKISFIADYLVEWYVENDPVRYKHLSVGGVPTRRETSWDGMRKVTRDAATHAIVCAVLEVPLPDLDGVTSQMRASSKLRLKADYLVNSAAHADDALRLRDRVALLERHVIKLRGALIDEGKRQDLAASIRSKRAGARANADRIERVIHEVNALAFDELARTKAALDEKRADVAARLLMAMPDHDDLDF